MYKYLVLSICYLSLTETSKNHRVGIKVVTTLYCSSKLFIHTFVLELISLSLVCVFVSKKKKKMFIHTKKKKRVKSLHSDKFKI